MSDIPFDPNNPIDRRMKEAGAKMLADLNRSDLARLVLRCKAGVYVTCNKHRDYYVTADRYIDIDRGGGPEDLAPEIRAKMIETDTIIEVQFYPATPVGFYDVWHHDLDAAIAEAHRILDEEGKERCQALKL